MKSVSLRSFLRFALCVVSFCAVSAATACYNYDTKNGTVNLGSETQINSNDRFIIYQVTVNLNEGAFVKSGGKGRRKLYAELNAGMLRVDARQE
jgi:hypothetical protein